MSFGFNIGDFLAVAELTNKLRREFVSAPSQFKDISNKIRSLSIAIQDADVVLSECELDAKQKTDLQEITGSCYKILSDLEKTLNKYDKPQTNGGKLDKRVKRVWKKLDLEPEDIRELGDRITLNFTLLNTYIRQISAQAAFTANMEVNHLNEQQGDQEQFSLTLTTTSRHNYFFQLPEIMDFKYKPIALQEPAFRLLRLLKGDSDLIQCQLFDSKLPPPALPEYIRDYAALSYTWGSQYRPCEILINGSKMTVTKNAYLALRDLRYQEKDRILWIDALCINQNDDKERSEQVQQMGTIYSNAERVVIWLGEATYDTSYFMYYIKQLEKESTKYAHNGQEISYSQWMNIWSAIIQNLNAGQRDVLVEGLRSLLHQNWFKRVWIIQEVANAHLAEITCGGKSASGSIFALMPSLLKITPDSHCQPILDIMPGPLRNSSWWAKKRDLHTLLAKFCESEATDPLDRVYALLNISSDACNTDLLKANYEKNLQDAIFDTALFLLNYNNLSSPISRLFDWTLPELFGNLHFLATEVLKCVVNKHGMSTEYVALAKLLLVRDDIDINLKIGQYNQTPLIWAAKNGHETVVKLLLDRGAKLETKDSNNHTSLFWAIEAGHEAVVKLLLDRGAELEAKDSNNYTPLFWAIEAGHEAVVRLLLDRGAELEAKTSPDNFTPLYLAAKNGHEAVVKLLLDRGAELEAKISDNSTPLHAAVYYGHEAVVKLLLDRGAELEAKTSSNSTPLRAAAYYGHEAVVKLLLDRGAELKAKDSDNSTPLHAAVYHGHEAVVKLLLDRGAELEAKTSDNSTPLCWAAYYGHEAVVKLLLDRGAKLEAKDSDNYTPLHAAAYRGHEAVVKLLLDRGAELEAKTSDNSTPLCWAAYYGHEAVVKLLLERGAEIEAKDKGGLTPLRWAVKKGHKAVEKLLLNRGAKDTR